MKFHHIGIPTTGRFAGEIDLPALRMTVSDHREKSQPGRRDILRAGEGTGSGDDP